MLRSLLVAAVAADPEQEPLAVLGPGAVEQVQPRGVEDHFLLAGSVGGALAQAASAVHDVGDRLPVGRPPRALLGGGVEGEPRERPGRQLLDPDVVAGVGVEPDGEAPSVGGKRPPDVSVGDGEPEVPARIDGRLPSGPVHPHQLVDSELRAAGTRLHDEGPGRTEGEVRDDAGAERQVLQDRHGGAAHLEGLEVERRGEHPSVGAHIRDLPGGEVPALPRLGKELPRRTGCQVQHPEAGSPAEIEAQGEDGPPRPRERRQEEGPPSRAVRPPDNRYGSTGVGHPSEGKTDPRIEQGPVVEPGGGRLPTTNRPG